ncbi:MAG: glycosyltransferase family 1 protein [Lactobacillus sp.]|nr:MAG: glycosyltransferase family 1 protein [Lactobacillus sp.]
MRRITLIRVLQLTDSINRSDGRTQVVMNVYRRIDKSQFQFDFTTGKYHDDNFKDEIEALGGKIYTLKEYEKFDFFKIRKFINKILTENSYDIVHYHASSIWGEGIKVAKRLNVPVRIMHAHNDVFGGDRMKSARNYLFSLGILRDATDFFSCSNKAGNAIFGTRDFTVFHNAIDIEKFRFNSDKRKKIRQEFSIGDNVFLMGQVGRLSAEKNQEFSIKLLSKLKLKKKSIKLLIIGEGSRYDHLKEFTKKFGVENNVIFTGQRTDVNDLYSALDVLILPSQFEGLPVTTIEAQSAGLPVLMSDNITKEAGIINCDFLSLDLMDSWIKKLTTLSSEMPDETNREKFGDKMDQTDYSDKRQVVLWNEMYKKLVKER